MKTSHLPYRMQGSTRIRDLTILTEHDLERTARHHAKFGRQDLADSLRAEIKKLRAQRLEHKWIQPDPR